MTSKRTPVLHKSLAVSMLGEATVVRQPLGPRLQSLVHDFQRSLGDFFGGRMRIKTTALPAESIEMPLLIMVSLGLVVGD